MWKPIALSVLCVSLAFAKNSKFDDKPERRTIEANAEIKIEKYFDKKKLFLITLVNEQDQGPFVTRVSWLKEAIGNDGDEQDFLKNSAKDKSTIYNLKTKLPILWQSEIEKELGKIPL